MKRFQFKLEAPLRFRRSRRDQCRQLLAQLLADERASAERRESLENERLAVFEELRQLNSGGRLDVDQAAARRFFVGHLLGEIAAAKRNEQLVAQQVDLCRQALRKAEQDVQSLEKMREKHLAEFRYEQERAEAREVEETWSASRLARAAR